MGRIRINLTDTDTFGVSDWKGLDVLGGSGFVGRFRKCLDDPDMLGGSGYVGRIRIYWEDPDMLGGSGYIGRIRV